ncbi:NADPH-dependent F420 reductase [Deinococcus alpinitundrae]|uniref:NADPH-dependent F420 reductase n=1 Tax=Deinococcus alpinitundrae TaxID=468913 RepID=UPI00137A82C1|nr:NAD(P)-binding domain-containing protein [Deinococcus alpinitundrae]
MTTNAPLTVSVLGTGRVGSHIAAVLAQRGHTVTLGSRSPEQANVGWTGPAVPVLSLEEAAGAAPLVVNALPGDQALSVLSSLEAALSGRVLLDVANATIRTESSMELLYPGSSLAEQLQKALPKTRVVKSLNTMMYLVMSDPLGQATPPTAFLAGNDEDAKQMVRTLLRALGWPPEWQLDLGDVTAARGTEALFLLIPSLIRTLGFAPFSVSVTQSKLNSSH